MKIIKVLLADDHTIFREGTRSIIEQEPDIEVTGEAVDGGEAIRMAKALRPHIVIIDIAMAKAEGTEVIRRIRAESPSTAILVLTSEDNNRLTVDLLEAGASGYLLKNVSAPDLINAIHAIHAGEAVLHPIIARKIFNRLGDVSHTPPDKPQGSELSRRELEILRLAAGGMSNQDIAARLYLSHRTVQAHLANIFRKMNVASRTEAVLEAMRKGWLGLEDLP